MRVVCDTNILISSIISPGDSLQKFLRLWEQGELTPVASLDIVAEYKKVLQRLLYKQIVKTEAVEMLLYLIEEDVELVSDFLMVNVARDFSENKFIECALVGQVKYIVSGDDDLLSLGSFGPIQIVELCRLLEELSTNGR